MKSMSEKMFEGIRGQLSKSMGLIAMKSGEVTMETSCGFLLYEPKIPDELLKKDK